MDNYKDMYYGLVGKVDEAIELLKEGLLEAEEKYISLKEDCDISDTKDESSKIMDVGLLYNLKISFNLFMFSGSIVINIERGNSLVRKTILGRF